MVSGIVSLLVRLDFFNVIKYIRYYRKKSNLKGKNIKFSPNFDFTKSTFAKDIYIGNHVVFRNSFIDSNSYVNDNSKIINTTIGKFCSIGPNVKIILGKHPTDFVSTHPAFYSIDKPFKSYADKNYINEYESVKIGNDVWIGENVIIPSSINVGNGAIIAVGSIVTKDVEPYSIVAGIPAKHVKYRFDRDIINKLEESLWWEWPESEFYKNFKAFHNVDDFLKLSDH